MCSCRILNEVQDYQRGVLSAGESAHKKTKKTEVRYSR